MTQREEALKGNITLEMKKVAEEEGYSPEEIRLGVLKGEIVIAHNNQHKKNKVFAVGKGLRTKVNANIGTSSDYCSLEEEMLKLQAAVDAGADAVMDLSTAGNLNLIRRKIIEASPVAVGTVPIYQAMVEGREAAEDFFEIIEQHCADGVDFITVHCGIVFESIARLKNHPRVMDVVSRGGAFLINWILKNKKENPLYENYAQLLKIAKKYDVALSLGDGLRPGCIDDATDRAQIQELIILGELTKKAWEAGVQVMVEGPGHVPYDQIEMNIKLEKEICQGAPFYVLGPLPTDIAPGYDHITSAIGGAAAACAGADFLCYVTRTEHLGLPTVEDVREGVVVSRIAGHIADIAKKVPGARLWDQKMAEARKNFDWDAQIKLALDPLRAKKIREERSKIIRKECSMCGDFCSMKTKIKNANH